MSFADLCGPPARGGGSPTKPVAARGGAVEEAAGAGRVSAASGVACPISCISEAEGDAFWDFPV